MMSTSGSHDLQVPFPSVTRSSSCVTTEDVKDDLVEFLFPDIPLSVMGEIQGYIVSETEKPAATESGTDRKPEDPRSGTADQPKSEETPLVDGGLKIHLEILEPKEETDQFSKTGLKEHCEGFLRGLTSQYCSPLTPAFTEESTSDEETYNLSSVASLDDSDDEIGSPAFLICKRCLGVTTDESRRRKVGWKRRDLLAGCGCPDKADFVDLRRNEPPRSPEPFRPWKLPEGFVKPREDRKNERFTGFGPAKGSTTLLI